MRVWDIFERFLCAFLRIWSVEKKGNISDPYIPLINYCLDVSYVRFWGFDLLKKKGNISDPLYTSN